MQLRFARRTDYALRAALELAASEHGALRTRQQIALATGAPSGVVAQALADLARAGIATAMTGRRGGYRLAREAASITVYEIVVALESIELEVTNCVLHDRVCSAGGPCPFHHTVTSARAAFADALRETTLADAVARPGAGART
jgi:Rrf2 family protein